MSRPENYMRALHKIRQWGEGSLIFDNGWVCEFHHVPKDIRVISQCVEEAGDAAVEALAALYDKEHADD